MGYEIEKQPTPRAVSIEVWWSPGCDSAYSISLCDEAREEIRCLGGDDDEDSAWRQACEHADAMGLPARLVGETSEVEREYGPTDPLVCPRCDREIDEDETPCQPGGGVCVDCCDTDAECPCRDDA